MKFLEKLQRLTEGKSKALIARSASLSPTAINDYLHKGYLPRADKALALSRALKVPLEWLVDDAAGWPAPELNPAPSPSKLTDRDLMLEIASHHRKEMLSTLEALDLAERMITSKSYDATPDELRHILLHAYHSQSSLDDYSPRLFADQNHAAMPGSHRPLTDFDPGRIKGRIQNIQADAGFADVMRRTAATLPDTKIPNTIPIELFRLLIETWTGVKTDWPGPFASSVHVADIKDAKSWASEIASRKLGQNIPPAPPAPPLPPAPPSVEITRNRKKTPAPSRTPAKKPPP